MNTRRSFLSMGVSGMATKDVNIFTLPKSNVEFWKHKNAMNISRDYANNVDLRFA